MTKTYLRTCCFSGEIIKQFLTGANEVKQNDSQESILQPPNLWHEHERLNIKIEHFADAPMHMLFLGVTKHYWRMLNDYLGTRILLFEYLVESYLNISSLAEISLLIGVQLLILQMVTF